MLKRIGEAEVMPKGYGVAYYEPHMMGAVIAPIPFNIAVTIWKRIEWALMSNCLAPYPKICRKCFDAGFYRGRIKQWEDRSDAFAEWLSENGVDAGRYIDDKND